MNIIFRSIFFFWVAHALAVESWNTFARTTAFYEAALANRTLILATDGGVRFIYSNGASEVYSSENGLESSEIYGVVHTASGEIFAVSSLGVVSHFLGNGKFLVHNRSFASLGTTLVPGLLESSHSILVMGFRDRIAFYDYSQGKFVMSVARIADVSLKSRSPSAFLVRGDSLFVALGNSVYVREMQWDAMRQDVLLSDPSSWDLAATFASGDSSLTEIQRMEFDGKKWTADFKKTLSPIVALGDTLSSKKFPSLWKKDSSKVRQVVEDGEIAYLVGADSAWVYDGGEVSNVSEWSECPLERPYVITPFVGGEGGITAYSEGGDFGWSDGEGWNANPSLSDLPYYGGTEPPSRLLKNLSSLADQKTLVGIWGFGWRLYSGNGLGLEENISMQNAGCVETYLPNYIVPGGVTAAPDSVGWLVSYWGKSSYGIAYIDESGNVSCVNQAGTGKFAGPLIAAFSEDSSEWVLYSGAGLTEGVEGYGSLDIFRLKPVSQNGGELSVISKENVPTPGHYALIDMDLEKSGRLWGITYADFAYWEPGMDSVQAPHKTQSYEQASLSSIAIDPNGRLWLGTIGSGAYMIQKKGSSPDTMKTTKFVSRDGLLSDIVFDVTVDGKLGEVWFVHKNGLSRYARTDLRETGNYMTSEGPQIKVYPNPVRFDLNQSLVFENVAESAVISVYNSGKHLVRSFSGGELDGGKVEWNGEDKRGVRIAPGVYHYIIKNGGKTKKGKILVVH